MIEDWQGRFAPVPAWVNRPHKLISTKDHRLWTRNVGPWTQDYGRWTRSYRVRPYFSWLETQSEEDIAEAREISPASTVAAITRSAACVTGARHISRPSAAERARTAGPGQTASALTLCEMLFLLLLTTDSCISN